MQKGLQWFHVQFSRHLDFTEVNATKATVIMMRTAHLITTYSVENGKSPMYDLMMPAAFDVGTRSDTQLRLPS